MGNDTQSRKDLLTAELADQFVKLRALMIQRIRRMTDDEMLALVKNSGILDAKDDGQP